MATKQASKKTAAPPKGDIAEEFKTTPAAEWKKRSLRKTAELTLPSGFTCKVARVDLLTFMKTGRIPNSLRSIIDKAMGGKEVSQDEIVEKLIGGDSDALKTFEDMMTMADAVVVECMVEPKVVPAPASEEERSETDLHVDEIDPEDRMFIFNFAVGGTRDLETFREGQAGNVERILALQGGEGSSE